MIFSVKFSVGLIISIQVLFNILHLLSLPPAVPIARRAPTIDKTNGSLQLTFARGTRGEINCFVMSESLFTIDWFLDGWPIRDQLFEAEYQVTVHLHA